MEMGLGSVDLVFLPGPSLALLYWAKHLDHMLHTARLPILNIAH